MKKNLVIIQIFFTVMLFSESTIQGVPIIDWKAGTITIDAIYTFDGAFSPSLRLSGDREIEKAYPQLLKENLLEITLDSNTRIIDVIMRDRRVLNKIDRLYSSSKRLHSYLSDDLTQMRNSYILHMYPDLAEIFITHTIPNIIRPVLEPVPRANFTGILIYAKGEYPVYGESKEDNLRPGLFPKIRDFESQVILSKEHMLPETILDNGIFYYTDTLDDPNLQKRVGSVPMRIQIDSVFGIYRTDLILNENDGYLLLSSEHNIELLKSGRIAVVLDLPN